jgi:hypothetical protein
MQHPRAPAAKPNEGVRPERGQAAIAKPKSRFRRKNIPHQGNRPRQSRHAIAPPCRRSAVNPYPVPHALRFALKDRAAVHCRSRPARGSTDRKSSAGSLGCRIASSPRSRPSSTCGMLSLRSREAPSHSCAAVLKVKVGPLGPIPKRRTHGHIQFGHLTPQRNLGQPARTLARPG